LEAREERRNVGVSMVSKVRGLPGSGAGPGKCLRVTGVFVGGMIMPGKVGVKAVRGHRGFLGREGCV